MHEKGLQRQIGVDILVSRQQRRALAVPRLNRLSTAGFVPPPVYIGFPLFVLAKRRSEQLFTVPWRARGTVGFRADRNVGTLFCPASPRPAVRRRPRRKGPRRSGSPRGHLSFVPNKGPKRTLVNDSSEARTKEILCKPVQEQNPRLTRGLSAVYPQFIRGSSPGPRALFVAGC